MKNLSAANGIGMVLAQRGHTREARDIFLHVREDSPPSLPSWISCNWHLWVYFKSSTDATFQKQKRYEVASNVIDMKLLHMLLIWSCFKCDWYEAASNVIDMKMLQMWLIWSCFKCDWKLSTSVSSHVTHYTLAYKQVLMWPSVPVLGPLGRVHIGSGRRGIRNPRCIL